MLNRLVRLFAGDPSKRTIDKYSTIVDQINSLEPQFEALSDEDLAAKTIEFRHRLAAGETLDDLLPAAFAAVREASKRSLGLRHYDVQLIGGIVLHQGTIAEMRTGEGKTLVATLPLYLNALTGQGVHLITVNDYLARRDARWMAPIYHLLGLSVGVLQMAARTENGKKAFLVDLERESPHEDQHQLRLVPRREAYAADITYGTNSEFGFDYLRDNMTMRLSDRVQRGHSYAIIDEVDNVLIDEARTPLIISGPASDDTAWYSRMAQIVRQLRPEDYEVSEKDRNVVLTELGEAHAEELLGMPLRDPDRPEDVTPEQARLLGYLEQALRAQFLFKRNKDYLVQAGRVIIVDEFTGRMMPGRRWSDGLHQAVEAKEGVKVQPENVTYATITIQNYFRMYGKLSGMSGTALTEAEEFDKIYKLEVVSIPTNLEFQAARPESGLVELEERDEDGYKYRYYARSEDSAKAPVFWKRKDYPDVIYRTEEAKFRAIAREILRYHAMGRPLLVGTTSVELSERLSARLRAEPLRRLAQTLILRKAWFHKNNAEEDGRQVSELEFLNPKLEDLPMADMRRFARDLDVSLTPQDSSSLPYLLEALDLDEAHTERLNAALQGGIPHQVLNARKHDEEGQIIADAGAFGAVTIATNMAGRGVDIRLGGELPEETINQVRLLLLRADIRERMRRAGMPEDIDELPIREWPEALELVDPEGLRSRAEAVNEFLKYVNMEEQVRQLGGLHVIGSERHEARRIDNQLRGRSARQGDPGSSRFYLSMQDELMRLFGGQQAEAVMARMNFDDTFPLEFGMVSRLVEQSQTRVEGANFDVRKHLLEYDDVLNAQRNRIYDQRNRIFTKDDLSEDVTEMLRTEVLQRVPEALEDEDGPWKLLAWLEQIQPTLSLSNGGSSGQLIVPSFTLRLLLGYLRGLGGDFTQAQQVRPALLEVARRSLQAEHEHTLHTVRNLLYSIQDRLEQQLRENMETLDTFLEGLELEGEDGQAKLNPRQILEELSAQLRIPLRLSLEQQKTMRTDPVGVLQELRPVVEEGYRQQALVRLFGAVERRLDESLEVTAEAFLNMDWDQVEDQLFQAIESVLQRRLERLVDDGEGQITRDLEIQLSRLNGPLSESSLLPLLLVIPQGSRASFDRKTHRRMVQRTTRLTYIYFAAHLLENRDPGEVAEEVLQHLERAQDAIRQMWGLSLWPSIAEARWDDLAPWLQASLQERLDSPVYEALRRSSLQSLPAEDVRKVIEISGRKALSEIYRPLLLGVITELWVEYLTQMEALRVSVGLEAYAQRDPLVQYKSRASELFQNLLSNMRLAVVNRMFTYRPKQAPAAAVGLRRNEVSEALPEDEDDFLPQEVAVGLEDDTIEPEPVLVEPEPETITGDQDKSNPQELSRSQKRRRRRR
jgi:preprotein translocase subunit SecA